MRHNFLSPIFTSSGLAAIVIAAVLIAPAKAQTPSGTTQKTSSTTKPWTPTRTPDGQPDLQGVWTNATLTPFERPPELAGKATITEQEAAALEKKASENRVNRPPKPDEPRAYNHVLSMGETTSPPHP